MLELWIAIMVTIGVGCMLLIFGLFLGALFMIEKKPCPICGFKAATKTKDEYGFKLDCENCGSSRLDN